MKPMMFNADMVKAVREGRKTVTRRAIKLFVPDDAVFGYSDFTPAGHISARGTYADGYGEKFYKMPYQPGEIVYVPEAWRLLEMWESPVRRWTGAKVEFQDGEVVRLRFYNRERAEKWRKYLDKPKDRWQSPYHMPREAARLFLRITGIRVERLQDITMDGMLAEGVIPENVTGGQWQQWQDDHMRPVWDSTVRPKDRDLYGWESNPWVWVIEFERISKKEAEKWSG